MSADLYIQDLYESQTHNRYSYVKNNPLSLTDPTGYMFVREGIGEDNPLDNVNNGIGGYSTQKDLNASNGKTKGEDWFGKNFPKLKRYYEGGMASSRASSSKEEIERQLDGVLYALGPFMGGSGAQAVTRAPGLASRIGSKFAEFFKLGKVKSAANLGSKTTASFSQTQLSRKFKHASDFGVDTTKKNPKTYAEFQNAITSHLDDATTVQKGTYGLVKDSRVFFNPNTNNAVVLDKAGNFVTGFKLKPGTKQFENYMNKGFLR